MRSAYLLGDETYQVTTFLKYEGKSRTMQQVHWPFRTIIYANAIFAFQELFFHFLANFRKLRQVREAPLCYATPLMCVVPIMTNLT